MRQLLLDSPHLIERLEIELERRIYRQSYYEFFKVAFCQLHPGQEYDDNWHIEYICNVLQKEAERIIKKEKREKDIIINVPFRSAKSMICTVIFPVWCWTLDASLKFITVSFSGSLAIEHSSRSLDLINTPWFQRRWGKDVVLKPNTQAKGHYETIATGMRKATGVGGQITGSGADIILCLRGDQKIKTDQGEIEIKKIVEEKLKIKVASFNEKDGSIEYKNIAKHEIREGRRLIKIKTVLGKEIVCTEDHRILTSNRGYIEAGKLSKKDTLIGL